MLYLHDVLTPNLKEEATTLNASFQELSADSNNLANIANLPDLLNNFEARIIELITHVHATNKLEIKCWLYANRTVLIEWIEKIDGIRKEKNLPRPNVDGNNQITHNIAQIHWALKQRLFNTASVLPFYDVLEGFWRLPALAQVGLLLRNFELSRSELSPERETLEMGSQRYYFHLDARFKGCVYGGLPAFLGMELLTSCISMANPAAFTLSALGGFYAQGICATKIREMHLRMQQIDVELCALFYPNHSEPNTRWRDVSRIVRALEGQTHKTMSTIDIVIAAEVQVRTFASDYQRMINNGVITVGQIQVAASSPIANIAVFSAWVFNRAAENKSISVCEDIMKSNSRRTNASMGSWFDLLYRRAPASLDAYTNTGTTQSVLRPVLRSATMGQQQAANAAALTTEEDNRLRKKFQ